MIYSERVVMLVAPQAPRLVAPTRRSSLRAPAINERYAIMYTRYKVFSPRRDPIKQMRYVTRLVFVRKLTLNISVHSIKRRPTRILSQLRTRVSLHSNKILVAREHPPFARGRLLAVQERLLVAQKHLLAMRAHLFSSVEIARANRKQSKLPSRNVRYAGLIYHGYHTLTKFIEFYLTATTGARSSQL